MLLQTTALGEGCVGGGGGNDTVEVTVTTTAFNGVGTTPGVLVGWGLVLLKKFGKRLLKNELVGVAKGIGVLDGAGVTAGVINDAL